MKPVSGVGLWRRSGDGPIPAGSRTSTPLQSLDALATFLQLSSNVITLHKHYRMLDDGGGGGAMIRPSVTNPRIISAEPSANGELRIVGAVCPHRVHTDDFGGQGGPAHIDAN